MNQPSGDPFLADLGKFIFHAFPPRCRSCPDGFVCLPNIGDNPNFGYTSFDNLLWAMLTTFQLITLDFWENVYNMVSTKLGGL